MYVLFQQQCQTHNQCPVIQNANKREREQKKRTEREMDRVFFLITAKIKHEVNRLGHARVRETWGEGALVDY